MRNYKTIKKGKNLLILLPNINTPNLVNTSVEKFFFENKKLITELSIIYELILTSKEFSITSTSISKSLGISTKTLKSKLENLKRCKILYSFQFSVGKESSKVFYVLNLTGESFGELSAFCELLRSFELNKNCSLITYKNDRLNKINNFHPPIIDDIFKVVEVSMLSEVNLKENTKSYFKRSIINSIESSMDDLNLLNDEKSKKKLELMISNNFI